MQFEAVIMVRTVVPFEFEVDRIDIEKLTGLNEEGRLAVTDPKKYEVEMKKIDKQRVAAGTYAAKEITNKLAEALKDHGTIVDTVVEEVRER